MADFAMSRRQSIALQDPFVRFGSHFDSFARTNLYVEFLLMLIRALLPRGIIEREVPTYFFAVAYRSTAQATPSKYIFL